jgi:hypothetical protein
MNEHLRERILRKLDTLSDERGYQVLDFVEFLESRYAQRQSSGATAFTRFTEAIEDRLRAGKVSASTISEAMGLMNRAASVLNGALAAGRSVANDIVGASRTTGGSTAAGATAGGPSTAPGSSTPPSPPRSGPAQSEARSPASSGDSTTAATPPPVEASSPAHDTKMPGSGEEKL